MSMPFIYQGPRPEPVVPEAGLHEQVIHSLKLTLVLVYSTHRNVLSIQCKFSSLDRQTDGGTGVRELTRGLATLPPKEEEFY